MKYHVILLIFIITYYIIHYITAVHYYGSATDVQYIQYAYFIIAVSCSFDYGTVRCCTGRTVLTTVNLLLYTTVFNNNVYDKLYTSTELGELFEQFSLSAIHLIPDESL